MVRSHIPIATRMSSVIIRFNTRTLTDFMLLKSFRFIKPIPFKSIVFVVFIFFRASRRRLCKINLKKKKNRSPIKAYDKK